MGKVEELATNYGFHIEAPWQKTVSGAQRVMMVVYEKELERTLRSRVGLFEQATLNAGHNWNLVNCTKWFSEWMTTDDYREAYFEEPELLSMKLEGEFKSHVADRLIEELRLGDENSVVAVIGTASLYGFTKISELVRSVEQSVRGRLVIFFPGTKDENNYRLLDARDGWNYLANGITLHKRGHIL